MSHFLNSIGNLPFLSVLGNSKSDSNIKIDTFQLHLSLLTKKIQKIWVTAQLKLRVVYQHSRNRSVHGLCVLDIGVKIHEKTYIKKSSLNGKNRLFHKCFSWTLIINIFHKHKDKLYTLCNKDLSIYPILSSCLIETYDCQMKKTLQFYHEIKFFLSSIKTITISNNFYREYL